MFENNPTSPDLPLNSTKSTCSIQSSSGPFLFERLPRMGKQPKRDKPRWSPDGHLRYLACLRAFGKEVGVSSGREGWASYRRMAQFISPRNSNQCRIHHKEMIGKHSSIEGILAAHQTLIKMQATTFRRYAREITKPTPILELSKQKKSLSDRVLKPVVATSDKKISVKPENFSMVKESLPILKEEAMKKEDLIPTDVAYPEQATLSGVQNRRSKGGYLEYCNSNPSFMGQKNIPVPAQGILSQKKKKQWEDCHKLFLAWTTKLHSLLNS